MILANGVPDGNVVRHSTVIQAAQLSLPEANPTPWVDVPLPEPVPETNIAAMRVELGKYAKNIWGESNVLTSTTTADPSCLPAKNRFSSTMPWVKIEGCNDDFIAENRRPLRELPYPGPDGKPLYERIRLCDPKRMDRNDLKPWLDHIADETLPDDRRFCFLGDDKRRDRGPAPATVRFEKPAPPVKKVTKKGSKKAEDPAPQPKSKPKASSKDGNAEVTAPKKKRSRSKQRDNDDPDADLQIDHNQALTPEPESPALPDSSGSEVDGNAEKGNPSSAVRRSTRLSTTKQPSTTTATTSRGSATLPPIQKPLFLPSSPVSKPSTAGPSIAAGAAGPSTAGPSTTGPSTTAAASSKGSTTSTQPRKPLVRASSPVTVTNTLEQEKLPFRVRTKNFTAVGPVRSSCIRFGLTDRSFVRS